MNQFLRRRFLVASAAMIAAPLADAEQGRKTYRVAFVLGASPPKVMAGPEPPHPIVRAFIHEMRDLGYVEGQNLVLERRSLESHQDRFPTIFTELAKLDTQVIVSIGGREELKQACDAVSPTPVVLFAVGDPEKYGLAKSLAHPGGNVTGLKYYAGDELEAKRLQVFRDAMPGLTRASYLVPKEAVEKKDLIVEAARRAAHTLGIELLLATYEGHNFAEAFAVIAQQKPGALFVSPYPAIYAYRKEVVALARKARLPDAYSWPELVQVGGLISYGVNTPDLGRRAAQYVDKILKGAKPGDLPFEQPTRFDLVVNLRTARELGLTMPPSVLVRATQVIE